MSSIPDHPQMAADDLRAAALSLLDETRPTQEEIATSIEQVLDIEYWRALVPELAIGNPPSSANLEDTPLDDAELARIRDSVRERGYYQTSKTISQKFLTKLRVGVDAVRDAGWHPVYAFLYDEAWLVARTPSVSRLVRGVLGESFRQIPNVWCHYVPAARRSSGWPPHHDGLHAATTGRLTAWIPVTEATLDNGCMYVIPRDMLPDGEAHSTDLLLQNTRALPASPGQVLGWDHNLTHWGSTCSGEAREPRIALSFEFIARDEAPTPGERPLYDVEHLPTFEQRLLAVARGVLEYAKFEPALIRFADLMEQTFDRIRPELKSQFAEGP